MTGERDPANPHTPNLEGANHEGANLERASPESAALDAASSPEASGVDAQARGFELDSLGAAEELQLDDDEMALLLTMGC